MKTSVKSVFVSGLTLAFPLGVLVYIFIKIVGLLEKVIAPVANRFSIQKLLGELTLTILAAGVVLLIIFLLGLFMRIQYVAAFRKDLEAILFRFFPSLNRVKVIAADTIGIEELSTGWKTVVLHHEQQWFPAFLVEHDEAITVFLVVKSNNIQEGEIVAIATAEAKYAEVDAADMKKCVRQYGKGMSSLVAAHF